MSGQDLGQGDEEIVDRRRKMDGLVSRILPPEDDEIVLPHWSEPPTGEIPRVVLEMSGDRPLWLDPSSPEDLFESEGGDEEVLTFGGRNGGLHESRYDSVAQEVGFNGAQEGSSSSDYSPALDEDSVEGSLEDEKSDKKSYRRVRIPRGSSISSSVQKGRQSMRSKSSASFSESEEPLEQEPSSPKRSEPKRVRSKRKSSGGGSTSGRSKSKSIVTGVVLGALVLAALAAGAKIADALVTVALVVAAAEYYTNVQKAKMKPAKLVGLVTIVLMSVGAYIQGMQGIVYALLLGVIVTFLWYLAGLLNTPALEGVTVSLMPLLWIGLLGSFGSMILRPESFHGYGVRLLLALLITTSSSDIFAYFGGLVMGKRKLAPSISPSKTYEGVVIGAVAAVILGAFLAGAIFPMNLEKGAVLGLVAGVITPLGDLCESMIKRSLNVKDTSNLLPGHGGILDRIDGVLFMLPAAYFMFQLFHLG